MRFSLNGIGVAVTFNLALQGFFVGRTGSKIGTRQVAKRSTDSPSSPRRSKRFIHTILLLLITAVISIPFVTDGSFDSDRKETSVEPPNDGLVRLKVAPASLDALLALSPEELARVDLARMNLLCAQGLAGAESIDEEAIAEKSKLLDEWAKKVKFETERHLYRLTHPDYKEHAEHFKHSEARFRAEWLVMTLQQDCGVHYFLNTEDYRDKPIKEWPPLTDARMCFVNGLVGDDFGGNCVSLPIVYAAVGRATWRFNGAYDRRCRLESG